MKGLDAMKVLLLQDVYKLGHAGDVKKVADGYGRNYLIPQGFATLATVSSIKQAETLRQNAAIARAKLNAELAGVAEKLTALTLTFAVRASETGKLFGSVTTAQLSEEIKHATGLDIERRNIISQPLRSLGDFKIPVRLTSDLVPTVRVIVHREGETPKPAQEAAPAEVPVEPAPVAEAPAPAAEAPVA
jgi:large subunit ribosomal protein L9